MFFLMVYGVIPEEPSTILKITQESTTQEVLLLCLQKANISVEKVNDYILVEEVARGLKTSQKKTPFTLLKLHNLQGGRRRITTYQPLKESSICTKDLCKPRASGRVKGNSFWSEWVMIQAVGRGSHPFGVWPIGLEKPESLMEPLVMPGKKTIPFWCAFTMYHQRFLTPF